MHSKIYLAALLFLLGAAACERTDIPPSSFRVIFRFQVDNEEGRDLIDSLQTVGRKTVQADFRYLFEQDGNSSTQESSQVTLRKDSAGYFSNETWISFYKKDLQSHNTAGRFRFDIQIPCLLGPDRETAVTADWIVELMEDNSFAQLTLNNISVNGQPLAIPARQTQTGLRDLVVTIPLQSDGLHLEFP